MQLNVSKFAIIFFCFYLSACSNYNAGLRKPQIIDGKKFGRTSLPEYKGEPYYFKRKEREIPLPPLSKWASNKAIKKFDNSEQFAEKNNTTALLIIRNDSILYENYFNGSTDTSITQLFSITKPLIASFLSQALSENKIESLDHAASDFIPLRGKKKNCEQLTLRHLAQMQSGFNHYDYFRLGKVLRLYYTKDVDRYITKARVSRTPGGKFKYKSFDTQVLGSCLEEILEEDDLIDRFNNLYWQNIQPEHKGYFSIDDSQNKNPKYYGGLNVSARDLAKIGKIYLNDGKFENKQVIDQSWMNTILDTTNHVGKWKYGLGWYFDRYSKEDQIFYGSGFNGQFLVINKTNNTIIVRLGASEGGFKWWSMLTKLSTLF